MPRYTSAYAIQRTAQCQWPAGDCRAAGGEVGSCSRLPCTLLCTYVYRSALVRPTPPGRWPDRDVVASSTGACLFSLALGISSVVLPLLALEAGHQAAVIGLLVSMSAAVQSLTRTMLAAVMRRFADRDLLLIAGVTQAASALAAVISPSVPGLVTAWAVQGVARACFWTGGQTHVARGDRSPMK